jgi:hypothetical protein
MAQVGALPAQTQEGLCALCDTAIARDAPHRRVLTSIIVAKELPS